MARSALPVLLLALAAPAAAALDGGRADAEEADAGQAVAQLTFHEHIVIRLPRLSRPAPVPVGSLADTPAPPIRWREKKGPKCVPVASMAGAMISSPTHVDLVMVGGQRLRVKLDGACEPLDFYSGFYLKANADGLACAGRDTIRVRSGAACDIDSFKKLIPAK